MKSKRKKKVVRDARVERDVATAPETGQPPAGAGLVCPACHCRHFYVVYTRPAHANRIIRRRACRHCGRRVLTVERVCG